MDDFQVILLLDLHFATLWINEKKDDGKDFWAWKQY